MKKVFVTFLVALFATVVLAQTKTEVKPNLLPKCVTEWVTANMKGFTVDKAFKIDDKGVISYVVRAIKGKEVQWLLFDKDCKTVKKLAVKEAEKMIGPISPAPPKPAPMPPIKDEKKVEPAPATPTPK